MIVASYKENPRIDLLPDESADWKDYRKTLAARRKKDRKIPSRWHGKVLACTDSAATVREIIQWYELRWQIELFFRELKSRMQLGCYVLMKFEAVERYLDFLLLGFLYLEKQRLDSYRAKGVMPASGEPGSHFRTTDGLRCLERTVQQFNVQYIAQCARSKRGLAQLISKLDHDTCHVA